MAPRSQLEIHTSSLQRLVKEEESYHRELQEQTKRVQKLETQGGGDDEENKEYMLKQERMALEETKNVLPSLKKKIDEAISKLDGLLTEEGKKGAESNVEHIDAAKEVIAKARTAEREIA